MRFRLAAAAAALLVGVACAHVEAPSGGPEDRTPPALLVTRPDTLAVVPSWNAPAVLVFDERLSERGVRDAVSVSPRTGTVEVEHRGDELRVRLRGGWQPGTIYHVTVLPGVQDLFNNRLAEPVTLVFSTGPEIPDTELAGVVTDPVTGAPEVDVRVEAIRVADSLVYSVPTDSSGVYRIRRVPEGEYQVRAFRDLNRNRALDEFEPRGVATVALAAGDPARAALGVLMPDSTPPQVAAVTLRDTATIEVRFDDHLDPAQELPPAAVQIRDPNGGFVQVREASVAPGESAGGARAGRGGRRQGAAADTASGPPLPSQTLLIHLGSQARIEPGVAYSIRIRSVRNLSGLSAPVETELEVEAPAADPRSSAPPDSVLPSDTARYAAPGPERQNHPNPS